MHSGQGPTGAIHGLTVYKVGLIHPSVDERCPTNQI